MPAQSFVEKGGLGLYEKRVLRTQDSREESWMKVVALMACACVLIEAGAPQTVAADATVPKELVGTWLAEDINSAGVIDYLQTTIELNDDGTYGGMAGCNHFTGTFTVNAFHIAFGPPAATRKLCVPAVRDQEAKFFKALQGELTYEVKDGLLKFYTPDFHVPVRFARLETTVDLTLSVPAGPIERSAVRYDCAGLAVDADYVNAGAISLVTLTMGEEVVVAANVIAASGAKYMGGQYTWWTKGDGATLYDATKGEDDKGAECRRVP